jgi:hypothetical protein
VDVHPTREDMLVREMPEEVVVFAIDELEAV